MAQSELVFANCGRAVAKSDTNSVSERGLFCTCPLSDSTADVNGTLAKLLETVDKENEKQGIQE